MLEHASDSYAGHSSRRRGASFAFQIGIPVELRSVSNVLSPRL